jgi:hypothetical protein
MGLGFLDTRSQVAQESPIPRRLAWSRTCGQEDPEAPDNPAQRVDPAWLGFPTANHKLRQLRRRHLTPDLAAIEAPWPAFPDAIKAGILAMVKA